MQVGCPVSGHEVNKEVAVETGNTKVAFCCEGCLAKYEKAADDEGKLKVLFANLEKGFTNQVNCPVSGKPINPKASLDMKARRFTSAARGARTHLRRTRRSFGEAAAVREGGRREEVMVWDWSSPRTTLA